MIRFRTLTVLLAGLLSLPIVVSIASAQEWELGQNDPNPYCSVYQSATEIEFTAGSAAHVLFVVWDSDSTEVVRTLLDSAVEPGYFAVYWDGRDEAGELVLAGDYPYVLTATDQVSGALIFEGSLVVEVNCCCSPTSPLQSWARVKTHYRY